MASSENIEDEIEGLLRGRAHSSAECKPDMTLDGKSKSTEDKKTTPIVGRTVCYVVCAVVFNEKGQVLLTREGFHPCYGKWYLPAGRVDPLETLEAAAVREVREETGLELKATSLLIVENPSPAWFRFTFTGDIIGGNLRTQKEADDETLEAGWWDVDTIKSAIHGTSGNSDPLKTFQLRGGDIVPLIEIVSRKQATPRPTILPNVVALQKLLLRLIILHKDSEGYSVFCIGKPDKCHVPIIDTGVSIRNSKTAALTATMQWLGVPPDCLRVHGVVAVEHDGRVRYQDGLCLSILLSVAQLPVKLATPDKRHVWQRLSKETLIALCETALMPDATITLMGR